MSQIKMKRNSAENINEVYVGTLFYNVSAVRYIQLCIGTGWLICTYTILTEVTLPEILINKDQKDSIALTLLSVLSSL